MDESGLDDAAPDGVADEPRGVVDVELVHDPAAVPGRTAMERSSNTPDVMLIDEVARLLKITPEQIRRLERRGAFPIPRLPKLDRHPRYARVLVERFDLGELPPLMTRRRRAA